MRFVGYYRVSTSRQGQTGYGLAAQQRDVRGYVAERSGTLIADFSEIRSSRRGSRPELAEALRTCRLFKAILVIGRLDRLSRNVALTAALVESGVEFVAVDFPFANRFTIHILAAIAEYESGLISERVKAALERTKARGTRLGRPHGCPAPAGRPNSNVASVRARYAKSRARARDLAPMIWKLVVDGFSRKMIAAELDRLEIRPAHAVPGATPTWTMSCQSRATNSGRPRKS